jgi:hypothetical protein
MDYETATSDGYNLGRQPQFKTAFYLGNIPLAVNLEPFARYKLLLIGNNAAGNAQSLVTIPMEVRKAGAYVHTGNGGTGWGFLVLVVGLAGLAGSLIHFWHPKQATTNSGSGISN